MWPNQDKKKWEYACQNCGLPYTSKPRFGYSCNSQTIVPAKALQASADDSGV